MTKDYDYDDFDVEDLRLYIDNNRQIYCNYTRQKRIYA